MLALTLFAPALIPGEDARARLAPRGPLYRWLCRAQYGSAAASGADEAVADWFGLTHEEELPHAALTLLGAGIDPGPHCWMHADPVHLHAQRTELVLVDPVRLEIRAAESAALLESLNAHFAQDDIVLQMVSPEQWFLRAAAPLRLRTVPLSAATGRNVDTLLPRGDQALLWNRRANEAQMLLHGHPVNADREARGAPAVNSLWLWGAGGLPACRTEFRSVWGGSSFVRGMALRAGATVHTQPADARAWLAQAQPGSHLVVLAGDAAHGDGAALVDGWIAPIASALAAGRIDHATLATFAHGSRLTWRLARSDLWKFWRRDPRLPSADAAGHA